MATLSLFRTKFLCGAAALAALAAACHDTGSDTTPPEVTASSGASTSSSGAGGSSSDAAAPIPGLVFDDDYGPGTAFYDFGGAVNAVSVDTSTVHGGTASLKIQMPASGYTGGAVASDMPEDLTSFDAVTFWAKADAADTIDTFGLGNDAKPGNTLGVELPSVALTTEWQKFVIPVPNPKTLTAVPGLFHFACGQGKKFHTLWLDDIHYEALGSSVITGVTAVIQTEQQPLEVGQGKGMVHGAEATFTVDGKPVLVKQGPQAVGSWPYFAYTSDTPSVATVDEAGLITPVSAGAAKITAKLGDADVMGAVDVTVTVPIVPMDTAPTPNLAQADVIALFSSAYTTVKVDSWRAMWSNAQIIDPVTINGHAVKEYTGLGFVGIEFYDTPANQNEIDASAMTALHLDLWTPSAKTFRVKLVDFGANKNYGGGDDSEAEVAVSASLMDQTWVPIEIPMSDFLGKNPAWKRSHLAQIILASDDMPKATVYLDNLYFHK